jgi:hypothetical protein
MPDEPKITPMMQRYKRGGPSLKEMRLSRGVWNGILCVMGGGGTVLERAEGKPLRQVTVGEAGLRG